MTVTASLLPNVLQQFLLANGQPNAGGQLYSYQAGTSTPQSTYTDATAGTANANPTILNAAGQASIWIQPGVGYKFQLQDASNNVIWTVDNVYNIIPGEITASMIAAGAIGTTQLGNLAVTTANIAAGAVTTAKMAAGSVTGTIIASGTIEPSNLDLTADYTQIQNTVEIAFKRVSDQHGSKLSAIPQYPWSSPALQSNPGSVPASQSNACRFSPDGRFLCVAITSSPYIFIYERTGSIFTKLANPTTLPAGQANDISWSPDGNLLCIGHNSSPYITIYKRDGIKFTKLPNPATLPSSNAADVAFSPNGAFLGVGQGSSGFNLYQVSTTGLFSATWTGYSAGISAGATYTDSAGNTFECLVDLSTSTDTAILLSGPAAPVAGTLSLATGTGDSPITISAVTMVGSAPLLTDITSAASLSGLEITDMAWSLDSQYLAMASQTGNKLQCYQRAGISFSSITISSQPASIPTCMAWTNNTFGQQLVCGLNGGNEVQFFHITAATTLTSQGTLGFSPAGGIFGVDFSPSGRYLAAACSTTPYIYVFDMLNLIALSNPGTLPVGGGVGVSWASSLQWLAIAVTGAPYIEIYETAGAFPIPALLWSRTFGDV